MLIDVEVRSKKTEVAITIAILMASIPLFLAFSLLVLSSFSKEMMTDLGLRSFRFTIENWINVLQEKLAFTGGIRQNILKYTFNTALVALGVAGVVTLISALSGYALSRMNFRGRKFLLLLMLHAFPGVALIVGVYLLYRISLPSSPSLVTTFSFMYVIVARAALDFH